MKATWDGVREERKDASTDCMCRSASEADVNVVFLAPSLDRVLTSASISLLIGSTTRPLFLSQWLNMEPGGVQSSLSCSWDANGEPVESGWWLGWVGVKAGFKPLR